MNSKVQLVLSLIVAATIVGSYTVPSALNTVVRAATSSPFSNNNSHEAFAATQNTGSASSNNATTIGSVSLELAKRMADIQSSNKPEDIATLAYIWGFPLITMERQFNFVTSPNTPPGIGHSPANSLSCARQLINANFADTLSPNSDTLFCSAQLDLKKEPVVLVVPPIQDRYYSFGFLDAYTNVYAYIGQRATGTTGGTYLIAGPDWNGQVPQGMTKIWTPTNLAWMINRILVKGPSDVPNVNAIQDKIIMKPLSSFLGGNNNTSSATTQQVNASKQIPIGPQPNLIAPTGIKIFDEMGAAMVGNPLNPPDPVLVNKLASIGIGPGKVPSRDANETIKAALQTGITEGQKMIDQKVLNIGTVVNGWIVTPQAGVYGNDYFFRAAATQFGVGLNIAQEVLLPITFADSEGKLLSGNSSYVIHFKPGQTPPVDAFWSITMYNNTNLLVDNPINRYSMGTYTPGLKNNTDGSLDIFIQHANPGKDKESNWLPAPQSGSFILVMRMYMPREQVLNGTWQYPAVQRVG